MKNALKIIRTKFVTLSNEQATFGVRIVDKYNSIFLEIESLPAADKDLLYLLYRVKDYDIKELIDFSAKYGVKIDKTRYTGKQIQEILGIRVTKTKVIRQRTIKISQPITEQPTTQVFPAFYPPSTFPTFGPSIFDENVKTQESQSKENASPLSNSGKSASSTNLIQETTEQTQNL